MNVLATPTPRSRSTRRTWPLRGLPVLLALVAALVLGACSTSEDPGSASPSATATLTSGAHLVPRAQAQDDVRLAETTGPSTTEPSEAPLRPSPSPTEGPTTWSAPSVKFYNEDTSIWHQDDSVIVPGTVDDNHNIEGYRTNNGTCLGYVRREASQQIFSTRGDDALLSSVQIERSEPALSSYTATSDPVVVDLVRDDSGTLQGYERAFTASHNSEDGSVSNPVEGYRFARTVGDEGFSLSVMLICDAGANLSVEQWHAVLSGLRLEGMDAGPM